MPRRTLLRGARVVTPAGVLAGATVELDAATVAVVHPGPPPDDDDHRTAAVDLDDGWLLPGFVDLHCHGGGGASFSSADPGEIRRAASFHEDHGTSTMLASLVSAPVDDLCRQLAAVASVVEAGDTPVIGAHLEGPFLAAERCGAQNPAHLLPPDRGVLERLHAASRGTLRLVTVAPELPGAPGVTAAALALDVLVAVGHTAASYEQGRSAFADGATVATHLFNGMPGLHHRQPGAALAALHAGAVCELIADGQHVHPAVLRTAATLNPSGLALVTDAISAAGAPEGRYDLGGLDVVVAAGRAELADGSSLAGSVLTMDRAVRVAVRDAGLSVPLASAAASSTPASALGIGGRTGSVAVGLAADLVHLDDRLRLTHVVRGGRVRRAPGSIGVARRR